MARFEPHDKLSGKAYNPPHKANPMIEMQWINEAKRNEIVA